MSAKTAPAVLSLFLALPLLIPGDAGARTPRQIGEEKGPARKPDRSADRLPGRSIDGFHYCGTPSDPVRKRRWVAAEIRRVRAQSLPVVLFGATLVPVRWHVITGSDGQGNVSDTRIDQQINLLNKVFLQHGFQFQLVGIERARSNRWFTGCTGDIEREMKQALAIDPTHNLNIYSCSMLQDGLLGFAYYPWAIDESHWIHGATVDHRSVLGGPVAAYGQGKTVVHEVGHYLGLYHTFEGGCRAPGDHVADTPFEAGPGWGCPVGRDSCPQPGGDPVRNFMDYSDDACSNHFTGEQYERMHAAVERWRPGL